MGHPQYLASFVAALVAIGGFPDAALAKEPRQFLAAGVWAMDYADDSCRLVRTFADYKDQINLVLERFSLERPLRPQLLPRGLTLTSQSAKLSFNDGNEPRPLHLTLGKRGDGSDYVDAGSLSLTPKPHRDYRDTAARLGEADKPPPSADEELAAARRISSLTISGAFRNDVTCSSARWKSR